MKTIHTQAGDDSEGKMWGLEGSNILIVIGGFAIGITVAVWMFTFSATLPLTALGYGVIPAVLGIVYVFTLREGKPKSYDRDLLETFLAGRSWQTKALTKHHPLFFPLMMFCIFPLGFLHAQFVPSLHTDVQGNKDYEFTLIRDEPYGIYIGATVLWTANGTLHQARIFLNGQQVFFHRDSNGDTGSDQQSGHLGRLVKGAFTAGTKIRVKGVVEAPGDPTARLFSLSVNAATYDAAVNLTNLEQKINSLEATFQNRIDQNTDSISGLAKQTSHLKSELADFQQRLDVLNLEYGQFKTDTIARIDILEKRISSLEERLKSQIADLNQFKTDTASQFSAVDQRIASTTQHIKSLKRRISRIETKRPPINTLGIIGTSLGGTATLATGGLLYEAISDHAALHEEYDPKEGEAP